MMATEDPGRPTPVEIAEGNAIDAEIVRRDADAMLAALEAEQQATARLNAIRRSQASVHGS